MAEDVMISIQWRHADVHATTVDAVAWGIVHGLHPLDGRSPVQHDDPAPGRLVSVWFRVAAANVAEVERTCRVVMAALDMLTESCDATAEPYEQFIARRAAERKARVKS